MLGKQLEHPVLIGEGTFAKVYRVTDSSSGEFYACKCIQLQNLAQREKELLRLIGHPLFPKYKGYFAVKEGYCVLMEYVCGCNLKELVRRRGVLCQKQAVYIIMELAKGLVYLHEQSPAIIFRDIKPENVMIQMDGRIRLIDVGCACLETDHDRSEEVHTIAGSRGYAAPEQLCIGGRAGQESDVYALGSLFCFLMTGRDGKCLYQDTDQIFAGVTISRGLKQLIEQARQFNPRKRLPDMHSFMQELEVYATGSIPARVLMDWKAAMTRKKAAEFYYEQNIRKK